MIEYLNKTIYQMLMDYIPELERLTKTQWKNNKLHLRIMKKHTRARKRIAEIICWFLFATLLLDPFIFFSFKFDSCWYQRYLAFNRWPKPEFNDIFIIWHFISEAIVEWRNENTQSDRGRERFHELLGVR